MNDLSLLSEPARSSARSRVVLSGEIEGLQLGKAYEVQAIWRSSEETLYYIEQCHSDEYPTPWPAVLFEVVEPSLPSSWVTEHQAGGLLTTFKAWAQDATFYESLVNGERSTTYRKYRTAAQQGAQADEPVSGGSAA